MIIEILHFLLMPIIWLPIVIILGVLTYRNYKEINQLKVLNVDSVLLMLEIPKNNDKQELSADLFGKKLVRSVNNNTAANTFQ